MLVQLDGNCQVRVLSTDQVEPAADIAVGEATDPVTPAGQD